MEPVEGFRSLGGFAWLVVVSTAAIQSSEVLVLVPSHSCLLCEFLVIKFSFLYLHTVLSLM